MTMTSLNVNVGIDAGSHTSKLAYDDKVIAALDGFNTLELREQAEIFFDEPVFSCVVALPESLTRRERDDVIFNAKRSGFRNINIITAHDAMLNALGDDAGRVLVYDFGASKSDITMFDGGEVIDNEIISDVSGDEFDEVFAQWLSDRFTLDLIDKKILRGHAEKIKISLSSNEFVVWRDVHITADDLERLIHFTIKRAAHTIERFIACYEPSRLVMTGGCADTPIVRKIFGELNLNVRTDFDGELIARGVASKARELSKDTHGADRVSKAARLRELRGELIELEDMLTRKQKDRLYFLFRQAEGILPGDPAIITLMENLIKAIRDEELGVNR